MFLTTHRTQCSSVQLGLQRLLMLPGDTGYHARCGESFGSQSDVTLHYVVFLSLDSIHRHSSLLSDAAWRLATLLRDVIYVLRELVAKGEKSLADQPCELRNRSKGLGEGGGGRQVTSHNGGKARRFPHTDRYVPLVACSTYQIGRGGVPSRQKEF